MERSISSLAFKGSVAEAIVEAKRQKKLLVVYISGDNQESSHLENSTWTELSVAESVSKYCILLHILEGSTDAAHLSAIYPQKSVPCITAIGYNGVQLWQSEGLIGAEALASSLEKAWLSLHIQETILTAALATKKSEELASGTSDTTSFEQGSSSRSDGPSSLTETHGHSSEATAIADSEIVEENKHCEHVEDINTKLDDEVSPSSISAHELERGDCERSGPSTETAKESLNPVNIDLKYAGVDHISPSVEDGCLAQEENLNVVDQHSRVSVEASRVIPNEGNEAAQVQNAANSEVEKADVSEFSTSKSNDVHLNIRLPDGASLQEKFSVTSTLRMVKDYVDEHQESSVGSYDLAIPYPRSVFNDQDLSKALSELGLFNRQALIVVPHQRGVGHHKGRSSLPSQTTSTNDSGSSNGSSEGYLSFVKKIISYINPFSYLGGGASSSSSVESQSSMWQYSPNSTLQNNLRVDGRERPSPGFPSNQNTPTTGRNINNTRQQTSRLGSNIHTLRHDEDDSRFSDRNAFWNGNSTQYGGDNNGK